MRSQIIAFVLTAGIVFGVAYYFVGDQLNLKLPEINFTLPDWFSSESEGEDSKPSSTNTNSGRKNKTSSSSEHTGSVVDQFNGVKIYYNGEVGNVYGRNKTKDGYNLGLKYQCVEFGKRYYYEYFGHKMPDSYGHAKDFFDSALNDGAYNSARALHQYQNPSLYKPKVNDMLIYGPSRYNSFGHIAIISDVDSKSVEIVQQNPGLGNPHRERLPLINENGRWNINASYVVGWLRKK